MLSWEERPIEVANLLNPAFCSILLRDSVVGFRDSNLQGMPYPIAFLVLPLVLHKMTREALPRSIATKMHVWLQNNPEVRIDFAERTRRLVPYTKEALVFAMRAEVITISGNGNLFPANRLGTISWPSDAEPAILRSRAKFLGRWFARAGDVPTIFAIWGIRP